MTFHPIRHLDRTRVTPTATDARQHCRHQHDADTPYGFTMLNNQPRINRLRYRTSLALTVLALTAVTLTTAGPAGGIAGFGDVPDDRFFTEPVQWMVNNEITTGTTDTCFSPDDTVTRGQAAAFMWRMEGRQSAPPHQFTDVHAPWQQEAVSWMADQEITEGTTRDTYSPERPLTRGQAAALLWRLAGEPDAPPHQFTDVHAPWQQEAVSWMASTDPVITTGTTPTTFAPDQPVTRGELATFFWRYKKEPNVTVDRTHPRCDPTGEPVEGLDLASTDLWIGDSTTFTAGGFAPGSTATATLFSDPVELGAVTVNADGIAEFTVDIPSIPAGEHTLVIDGTDPDGTETTLAQPVVVGVDNTRPALVDVTVDVSTVNITDGAVTFNANVTATDAGTGIIAGGVMFTGCGVDSAGFWNDNSTTYPDGNIVAGTNTNGTWQVPVTVLAGLNSCTLDLLHVDLCDSTNNCVMVRDNLPSVTVSVVNNSSPDTTPPTLVDVSVDVSSVDITDGAVTFNANVTATDAGTGIIAGSVAFTGCDADTTGSWNDWSDVYPDGNLVSGTKTAGVWEVPVTVLAGLNSCTLTLANVSLCDATNQCVSLNDNLPSVTFPVVNNSNPDTTPPELIDVTVDVSTVDITSGAVTFMVDVTASDEGTGIIAGGVVFTGCNAETAGFWNEWDPTTPDGDLVSGTKTNGTWRVPVTVPAGLNACTLTLFNIDLCDASNQCVVIMDDAPSITVAVTRSD